MSQTKHAIHAAIAAVSILAIGVVLGILLDRTVLVSAQTGHSVPASASGLDERHQTFLRDLAENLSLSEAQAGQVHEILARHQSAVDEAWYSVHILLQSTIDSVTAEIEGVLDADQRVGLHEWLMEQHGVSESRDAGEGH